MRKRFSPDTKSYYHGPTSALFDEKSTETGNNYSATGFAKVPEACVNNQLVAESAKQHQLETVSFFSRLARLRWR